MGKLATQCGCLISFVTSVCWMYQEPLGRTQPILHSARKLSPVPCQIVINTMPGGEPANDNLWDYFLQICALIVSLCY